MIKLLAWVFFAFIAVASTNGKNPEGPTFILSQKEITLQKGQNFTIKCIGKGPLFLKHQDSPEEPFETFHMEIRKELSTDPNYETLVLDLYNVDQYAVGYYACFDNSLDGNETLNNLVEEPSDTEHISYIYVYVNGSNTFFAPMRETLFPTSKSMVVIGCRPTAPDIKVTLAVNNKTTDFVKSSPKIGFILRKSRPAYKIKCIGQRGIETHSKTIQIRYVSPPDPEIKGSKKFILGETFSVNCTIHFMQNYGVELNWEYPGQNSTGNIRIDTNENTPGVNELYYKNITVTNATEENEGTYTCISAIVERKTKSLTKKLVKPYLNWTYSDSKPVKTAQKSVSKIVGYSAYPPITSWTLSKNGKLLDTTGNKYIVKSLKDRFHITINNTNIVDTANYTFFASNKVSNNSFKFEIFILADPVTQLLPQTVKCPINGIVTLKCVVTGSPLQPVKWNFDKDIVKKKYDYTKYDSIYNETATLQVAVMNSTNVTCISGTATATQTILVYEVDNGFQIKDNEIWYAENEPFVKQCVASKYDYTNVYWSRYNGVSLHDLTKYSESELSHYATLTIDQIAMNDSGVFICTGLRTDGKEVIQSINITVEQAKIPNIAGNDTDNEIKKYQFQKATLTCYADGVPRPSIQWAKDGEILKNMSNIVITEQKLNRTIINSTLEIVQVQKTDAGKYVCKATGGQKEQFKFFNLVVEVLSDKSLDSTIISVSVVIMIILLIAMMYLIWKIWKEKQFKRELKAIGLYFFKNGVPKSINPDLFIDEQAELLPYDEKFEFPLDKLSLGKQIGAGAFGVVYMAEARGIIDAEKSTTVAVKMVKKTADNMYIKALASELKIMVHLGKHVNIVNLLGACTKNIARRELIVIVEYCKFGNLHNYLQKHREVFIDQFNDSKDNQFGKVNRGYSCSSGNSGMQSDYFGSNHTQLTDHTFVNNTANTNKYSRKISETGYVMSEPTYGSDCSILRALCTRDLLCWSFQIARGMEYLTSRKVLHGDLAARNILLAEDNVVKICDFGLAKSMYKNDEYLKTGDGLLPVKWLAIECMTDRIFSTQSDVWAFGIVLWELFSLAKTPYPNIRLEDVLQWLTDGHRLDKPQYADDRLYDVMKSCWEQKPTLRPTFTQLQEKLGSFLEDNVRNHYIDLNATYVDLNKKSEDQEDYLAMVCAPDYNIMVAPSPHHYVNGNVAQLQLQHDPEGYLQMTPTPTQNVFSPRPQGTKFDFDVKKLTPKTTAVHGHESELTPMLPINGLMPINGSESDIECNFSSSPNPCPRIEEETDDVFDNRQNNVKNMQDTSVSATNPIYITFDENCLEKKSQLNNYANVPNGLVS